MHIQPSIYLIGIFFVRVHVKEGNLVVVVIRFILFILFIFFIFFIMFSKRFNDLDALVHTPLLLLSLLSLLLTWYLGFESLNQRGDKRVLI